MAKDKAAKPTAKAATSGKKSDGKLKFFVIAFVMGIALLFVMPTFVLILVGMIPTYIALFSDTDNDKSSSSAIGAMNFAGVVPFILDLWMKGQSVPNVISILRDPSTWLVMLGAAGIGHLIVYAVPQATATLTLIRMEARLKILKKNLDTLRESWGPEVGTVKSLDTILRKE